MVLVKRRKPNFATYTPPTPPIERPRGIVRTKWDDARVDIAGPVTDRQAAREALREAVANTARMQQQDGDQC